MNKRLKITIIIFSIITGGTFFIIFALFYIGCYLLTLSQYWSGRITEDAFESSYSYNYYKKQLIKICLYIFSISFIYYLLKLFKRSIIKDIKINLNLSKK